uniref:Con-ikot-ikot n=1 Tax=Conus ermineus TaxID=55423 RepID=A0A346CJ44_CONER|nr:con-ikot-ikot [Conus ermineus]
MAMNMSMTLSMFVMVVVAATVTGSTRFQKRGLRHMKRDDCCIGNTYGCLKRRPGQEHEQAMPCKHEATIRCPGSDIDGCCPGYATCMSIFAKDNLIPAHYHCEKRPCYT